MMVYFKGFSVVAFVFLVLVPNPSFLQSTSGRDTLTSYNRSTLIVTTFMKAPYCLEKGNDKYDGFVPDMLMELEKLLGASFRIQKSRDGAHGTFDQRTNTWNGIVGEVINGNIDIGFADLTVTAAREKAIDFTLPFMEADLTIIYRSKAAEPVAFGWLLSSMSLPLWFSILASYVAVSAVLFAIGKIRSHKSENKDESELSLSNSVWVTTSSILLRGTDVPLVALSTRLLVSAWWFFSLGVVLILIVLEVSMFTSGAAFVPAVPNFFGRSGSESVGVIHGGSSYALLQERSDLASIKQRVEAAGPLGYPKTTPEGIESVLNGKLDGFVIESPTADIFKASNCDLKTIPDVIDKRSFAIAVKQGSPLRDVLSVGLLKLRETGKLDSIKNRWWPKDRCLDYENTYLSPANLGTYYMLFVVLFIVICVSLLVALIEKYIYRRNISEITLPKILTPKE